MPVKLNERELANFGLILDAGDPNQLVPVKDFHDSLPNESWDLERLAQFARNGFDEAERLENEALALARRSTVHVYRAGHALVLARDRLKLEGKWCAWQDEHGIPRTSAWEAIQLFERAESEEEVATLTPTEAKERYEIYPTNGSGQTAEHSQEPVANVLDGRDKQSSPKSVAYWERAADVESNTTKHYPTPPAATEALLEREYFEGSILEPACGEGAIVEVLKAHGYKVIASDLTQGKDFLDRKRHCENIVTNPPHADKLTAQFVAHALALSRRKVAVLVPLYFLEGIQRCSLFTHHPLKTVYVFSRRPKFTTNEIPFGCFWLVWDKAYTAKATIDWIA